MQCLSPFVVHLWNFQALSRMWYNLCSLVREGVMGSCNGMSRAVLLPGFTELHAYCHVWGTTCAPQCCRGCCVFVRDFQGWVGGLLHVIPLGGGGGGGG